MPVLTVRMSDEEIATAAKSVKQHSLNRSEFARRAINAASAKKKKDSSYPLGVLKGRISYPKAMRLLRG